MNVSLDNRPAVGARELAVLLVDPYGLYGWYEKAGVNRVKPPLTRHQNEIKLARALRLQPTHSIAVGQAIGRPRPHSH